MRVLMISSDARIGDADSAVSARLRAYGSRVESLEILVCARGPSEPIALSDNIRAHFVASSHRILQLVEAYRVGRTLERPNVVTAQDPFELGVLGIALARYFGARTELQVHTDCASAWFRAESLKNRIRVFLARRTLRRADTIRAVSERVARGVAHFASIPRERVRVLPIAYRKYSKPSSSRNTGRNSLTILFVGRLAREKDIATSIAAFALLRKRFPAARFIIAGEGPERGALEGIARSFDVLDAIEFRGWVDDPEELYHSSDVYLSSSLYEGYGLSLVEAARAGVPIVTTPVGCVEFELHGDGVYVFRQGDAAAAAEALERAIRSADVPHVETVFDGGAYADEIVRGWETINVRHCDPTH